MSRLPHSFYTFGSEVAVRLSALLTGILYTSGRFLVLISVTGLVELRSIVGMEALGKFKTPPHLDSNPRPSGM
jgi:hypothetical protein